MHKQGLPVLFIATKIHLQCKKQLPSVLYSSEYFYRGDVMQIEFDELIKRILQLLNEKDKLTAEQQLKMYQRVFPVNKEAKDNGKG